MEEIMSSLWVAKLMTHAEIHQKKMWYEIFVVLNSHLMFTRFFHGKQNYMENNNNNNNNNSFFDYQRSGWQATEYHAPLWLEPGQFPVDVAPWWSGGGVFLGNPMP